MEFMDLVGKAKIINNLLDSIDEELVVKEAIID